MVDSVTVCLTSCGRKDLLIQTIDSFYKYNTYEISDFLIYEDRNEYTDDIIRTINERYPSIKIYSNHNRVGQRAAIDFLYSLVYTEYVYHCEDDWEFYNAGFIEKSLAYLKIYPKILQVHNRQRYDINGHPTEDFSDEYSILCYDFMGIWNGFSFNPGIRRMSDYRIIKSYCSFTYEHEISLEYKRLGYYAIVLNGDGFVRHIGYHRHIKDPTNGV